jgi:hypothetical protein
LSEYWQVAGRWWSSALSEDGATLTLEPTEVELGELRCLLGFSVRLQGPKSVSLLLISDRYGLVAPSLASGAAKVPAGEYRLESVRLRTRDGRGKTWELSASGGRNGEGTIEVATTPATVLDFARPLVGRVEFQERGRGQAYLSLVLTTAGGQGVDSLTVGGGLPAEPTFTITDASGKKVHSGKLEYG